MGANTETMARAMRIDHTKYLALEAGEISPDEHLVWQTCYALNISESAFFATVDRP